MHLARSPLAGCLKLAAALIAFTAVLSSASAQNNGFQVPRYEPTRAFYKKRGYAIVSHVPDYYADGDGLVVFCKRLT